MATKTALLPTMALALPPTSTITSTPAAIFMVSTTGSTADWQPMLIIATAPYLELLSWLVHPTYHELNLPISRAITMLILRWVSGIWAEELGCVDAVQTTHFALFLYEACGLNKPNCLIQAYNIAIGLIDSWMAYPQYTPFPLRPNTANIHGIFLQYHRDANHLILLLGHHHLSIQWNLLLPR
uniref:Uncharacterized protein n=1 Tax=Romanomermis culicivorax TaxID=13658 RepID=A0A915IPY2_ROMCU